jgi:lipopolysaccharide/colanic/teichoic acid biosynthesis glycosyltransferase
MALSRRNAAAKRAFDTSAAMVGLALTWWVILLAWFVATVDTRQSGLFAQVRIGRDGKPFKLFKIRTMRAVDGVGSTVTTANDPRITPIGQWFRRFKLDELPQLLNVLLGDMSIVGPRPDVPGFADRLTGEDRVSLSVRPGITGPATIKYRNEAEILALQRDPEGYNRDVIFPDKVRINCAYVEHWSFGRDLELIWQTLRR